jgi:NAD-dependent deacetylase
MSLEQAREWIAGARRIVGFTGAGISTESNIPDFRSPNGATGHGIA